MSCEPSSAPSAASQAGAGPVMIEDTDEILEHQIEDDASASDPTIGDEDEPSLDETKRT